MPFFLDKSNRPSAHTDSLLFYSYKDLDAMVPRRQKPGQIQTVRLTAATPLPKFSSILTEKTAEIKGDSHFRRLIQSFVTEGDRPWRKSQNSPVASRILAT